MSKERDAFVSRKLASMSLEEKVGQCLSVNMQTLYRTA